MSYGLVKHVPTTRPHVHPKNQNAPHIFSKPRLIVSFRAEQDNFLIGKVIHDTPMSSSLVNKVRDRCLWCGDKNEIQNKIRILGNQTRGGEM